jgi:phage-related protein
MTTRKTLSIASAIEAHRLSSEVPYLCLLDIDVVDPATGVVVITLNYANNPEDFVFNGVTYSKGVFDISFTAEGGKTGDVSLSVNDYTQALEGYMQAYGGGVGSRVTFFVVNGATQAEEAVEFFEIVGASSSGYVQQFKLGAESVLSQVFPRRRQTKDFCQWRYKSADCGYSGTLQSCDLSLQGANGCAAHNNTINFGAYPGINSNGFRYA